MDGTYTKRASSFCAAAFETVSRRKHVVAPRRSGHQLARNLTALQLIPIGIGSTIGAGVYVLIGTVARERAGPSLTISFFLAGVAATLSAFCYAELASRCPSAGSAYHYAYICLGEGVAWIIGWGLVLEYTVGGSAVARGISPNLALFFGGPEKLPAIFMRRTVPGLDIVVDPCAGFIVVLVTILLCAGIKQSVNVASVVVAANVSVLLFVIVAGTWAGFSNGWPGYEQVDSYFPYGLNGTLAGAATLFFAYIGFDTVASTAEEVKHPQRDLPIGIGLSVFICSSLYMLVASVVVGLVPYNLMDPDTPMSKAFADNGMPWAMYIVTAGAVAALSTTLMGSLLPQPRILMAMARDGLLPPFFSEISKATSVPLNGTILSGGVAGLMAFAMDVDQLSGMVSVGTLMAFTVVGIAILTLRYVPPAEGFTRLPSQASAVSQSAAAHLLSPKFVARPKPVTRSGVVSALPIFENADHLSPGLSLFSDASLRTLPPNDGDADSTSSEDDVHDTATIQAEEDEPASPREPKASQEDPLLSTVKTELDTSKDQRRRSAASIAITAVCVGVICISLATSVDALGSWCRWALGILGLPLFAGGSVVLFLVDQDEGRHTFGQTGGFICPFVPALPLASILFNVYLLVNLGLSTWLRVSVWLVIGLLIYVFYGIDHSVLGKDGSEETAECGHQAPTSHV